MASLLARPQSRLEQNSPSLFALDSKAEAKRGEVSVVRIGGVPNFHNQLEFEIVKPPNHGVIKAIRPIDDHTAGVTYHHDGSRDPLSDSFAFRVKSAGRSPSAPALCTLRIIPPPASLVITPERIDFGSRVIGSVTRANIVLRNTGGKEACGRLILPSAVKAPDGDSFRLGEDKSCVIPLEFTPLEEKTYDLMIGTTPSFGEQHLRVTGKGICRFEFSQVAPLQWRITNCSDVPLSLECSAGNGWEVPRSMTIPPHESGVLTVTPSLKGAIDSPQVNSMLNVSDGLCSRSIPLPTPARFIPVAVRLSLPEDLGQIPLGGNAELRFQVSNRSELPKSISWRMQCAQGGGTELPRTLDLMPGESRELSCRWTPSLPGDTVVKILFHEPGSDEEVRLNFRARVLTPLPPERPIGVQASESPDLSQDPPPPGPPTLIPAVEDFSWRVGKSWSGKPLLHLYWKASPSGERTILSEQLLALSPGDDAPPFRSEFRNVAGFDPISQKDGYCFAEVKGLSPGWHVLSLRILGRDSGVPLASSQFSCRVDAPVPFWKRVERFAGYLLLGAMILIWWRIRKAAS